MYFFSLSISSFFNNWLYLIVEWIVADFFIQLEGDCDDLLYKILLAKEDLERVEPSSVELASRMEQYR